MSQFAAQLIYFLLHKMYTHLSRRVLCKDNWMDH